MSKARPIIDPRTALMFTLSDAMAVSGLSESTLRRLGERGELVLRKIAGRMLVDGVSLRRLLQVAEAPVTRAKQRGGNKLQTEDGNHGKAKANRD